MLQYIHTSWRSSQCCSTYTLRDESVSVAIDTHFANNQPLFQLIHNLHQVISASMDRDTKAKNQSKLQSVHNFVTKCASVATLTASLQSVYLLQSKLLRYNACIYCNTDCFVTKCVSTATLTASWQSVSLLQHWVLLYKVCIYCNTECFVTRCVYIILQHWLLRHKVWICSVYWHWDKSL